MTVCNGCNHWGWWGVLAAPPAAQWVQLLHAACPAAFSSAQCRAAPEMLITLDQQGLKGLQSGTAARGAEG